MNLLWLVFGFLMASLALLAFNFNRGHEPGVRSQRLPIVSVVCLAIAMLFMQLPTSQFGQVMTWVFLVTALALLAFDIVSAARRRFSARAK
jgi:hypothetical protein